MRVFEVTDVKSAFSHINEIVVVYRMNILFITRKYPPTKGGMEKVAYNLYNHLSKIEDVRLVKWSGSNSWLPLVLPFILIRSFLILLTNKVDVIYLQDGLLSPLGVILKIFRIPIVITIHGLDITYKNKVYQFVVPRCVAQLDHVICISQATKEECMHRGIPEVKITLIPNGVSDEFYINEDKAILREILERKINLPLSGKKILLSVGRLIERKGIHWFVENVIPRIIKSEGNAIYLIAGDGVYKSQIKDEILKQKLEQYVIMLGKVDDDILKLLYNSSDVFVMPNVPVEGDMEGFGIVALEGASCRLPVVASDLEGIKDAIKQGKNGFLIKPYDTEEFFNIITRLIKNDLKRKKNGDYARIFSEEKFGWQALSKEYISVFEVVYEAHIQ